MQLFWLSVKYIALFKNASLYDERMIKFKKFTNHSSP